MDLVTSLKKSEFHSLGHALLLATYFSMSNFEDHRFVAMKRAHGFYIELLNYAKEIQIGMWLYVH